MIPQVTDAKYLRDYKVYVQFNDGAEGVVDLEDRVGRGGVFLELSDFKVFRTLQVDPEIHTIVWKNGADLAPEYLYGLIAKNKN